MKSVTSRPLFIPVRNFLPVSSMTLGTSLNHSEFTSTSVKGNDPCFPGLLEGQGTSFMKVF